MLTCFYRSKVYNQKRDTVPGHPINSALAPVGHTHFTTLGILFEQAPHRIHTVWILFEYTAHGSDCEADYTILLERTVSNILSCGRGQTADEPRVFDPQLGNHAGNLPSSRTH